MALSWTLDKLGPLCLTADDCGLVLEAISGPDVQDPSTTDRQFKYITKDPDRDFKLAVLMEATQNMNDDIKSNFEESLKVLKRKATIEELEFPDFPYEAVTRIILSAEAASAFEEFIETGKSHELTAPEDRFGPYTRISILATDYLRALRLRVKIAKQVDKIMTPYDAIIAPTRRSPATPIDEEFRKTTPGTVKDIIGAIGNGVGLPSISVPNGFTKEGLPTGIQFMGKAYDENKILAIARAYQSITDWHTKHPSNLLPIQ
jgi:aspartyl-tRNA(Asn)/glutamyl-tRNA(Gln) amidotransferase subunit A